MPVTAVPIRGPQCSTWRGGNPARSAFVPNFFFFRFELLVVVYSQLVSLTVAELAVILLPIDAANNSGNVACGATWSDIFCGELNMNTAWLTIFMLIFVLALFVVPYTIFFYEEDDSFALT